MLKKKFIPVALSSLMFVSPFVMAVDEHHPEKASEVTQDVPAVEKVSVDATVVPSGTMKPGMMSMGQNTDQPSGTMMMGRPGMMGPGMTSGKQSGESQSGKMGPGMMMGGPGMMGNRGGMMRGGSSMMGQGGMMSQGMKGGHGKGMMGHGMMPKHQQVVNRLDLLDARMAKIEAMLERLIQR